TARGNLASSTDPDPRNDDATVTHTFTHDARGRLTSATAPDGASLTATFGPWEKIVKDADGGVNHQFFDGFGELREVEESGTRSSDLAHTSYEYNGVGRLVKITNADGQQTAFKFDGEGHRLSITRPVRRVWSYAY